MGDGETWRLGHRPALDGLRGVAVLLVVFEHALAGTFPSIANAGVVGVTMFFALSGFLITTLLLEERADRGRVSLPAFYRRRALRLMPAMLVTVALNVAIMFWVGTYRKGWAQVVGALTYTVNWVMADGDYPNTGLGHMWSLACEEQFYLIWPLLLVALVKVPRLWAVMLIGYGCVGALLLRGYFLVTLDNPSPRIYFGLDTRADSLLIGCGLAWLLVGRREHRPSRAWAWLGVALLVYTGLVIRQGAVTLTPLLAALGAALIIWAAVQGAGVRPLEARWLRYVGQRSYGLYLLQVVAGGIPVILFGDSLGVMLFLMLPVSWAAAWLSYRYVETPFLRMKDRRLDGFPRGERDRAVATVAVLEHKA